MEIFFAITGYELDYVISKNENILGCFIYACNLKSSILMDIITCIFFTIV